MFLNNAQSSTTATYLPLIQPSAAHSSSASSTLVDNFFYIALSFAETSFQ